MPMRHGNLPVFEQTPASGFSVKGPSVVVFNPSHYRTAFVGADPYVSYDDGMPIRPGERVTIPVADGDMLYAFAPEDNVGIQQFQLRVLYRS